MKQHHPTHIKWGVVVRLTRSAGLTEHQARIMFRPVGCEARIQLPNVPRPVYLRSAVLKALGIEE